MVVSMSLKNSILHLVKWRESDDLPSLYPKIPRRNIKYNSVKPTPNHVKVSKI